MKIIPRLCVMAAVFGLATLASGMREVNANPFAPGNIVVYRVGDGTQTLANTGNSVFLDEYTKAGALVQSILLPTASSGSNNPLIASGVSSSEGLLTRSLDGRYLVLTGYAAPITNTTNLMGAAISRTIGRVDSGGSIDTTTALSDYARDTSPRGGASADGTNFYVTGGSGGVRYATLGATTSTQLTSTITTVRAVNIFPRANSTLVTPQLYVTASTGTTREATVGDGLPTTEGQTVANLPGTPTTGSPYGFVLLDLNPSVPGADTLYVADDGLSVIQKYVSNGTTFSAKGTLAAASVRGLTASVSNGTVTLFATTGATSSTGGGTIYTATDSNAATSTLSGTATNLVTLSTSSKMVFRGIAFAPVAASATSTVKISQFRFSGPGGSKDEFIELANVSGRSVSLIGWSLAVGTGTSISTIAFTSNDVIAPGGHLLIVNNEGYSLNSAYPGDNSPVATGDDNYSGDIALNSTLALSDSTGIVVDAVGDLSSVPPTSSTSEYAYVRRLESGMPLDTGVDTTDFNLVDINAPGGSTQPNSTTGASGVATTLTGPRLGAPGPRDADLPIQRNTQVKLVPTTDILSDAKYPSANTYLDPKGRLTLRRKFTNNTGADITRLRFRITAITAGTSTASDVSDIRALTSGGGTGANNVKLEGLTLDRPSQPRTSSKTFYSDPPTANIGYGGGLNSSLTLAIPGGSLASGASINVEFNFGIIKDGKYRIVVDAELLP